MPSRALFLIFLGAFLPWCWRIARIVWSELQAASAPPGSGAGSPEAWPIPDDERARTSTPRRKPSFVRAPAHVARRPRWEAGFGRRSM